MRTTDLAEQLVLATANEGKRAEFEALLAPLGVRVSAQSEWRVSPVEETGLTFVENALIKARHAASVCGLPALADDSGLCVDALDGAPGLYSSRFAGADGDAAANNRKLLAALANAPAADRGASFYCCIVYLRHPGDPAPLIATGRWHGSIADHLSGDHGFGYDPLFIPAGSSRSAAQLSPTEKNARSHRGRAINAFMKQLGMRQLGIGQPGKGQQA